MDRADLAQRLMGAGAWWSGRGPDYEQTQNRQRELDLVRQEREAQQAQQLSEERKAAMALDFANTYTLLQQGRPDKALELLSNRGGDIERLGGVNMETKYAHDLIASGDVEGATREIGELLALPGVQRYLPQGFGQEGAEFEKWKQKEEWKRNNPMPMTPQEEIALRTSEATIANINSQMDARTRSQQAAEEKQRAAIEAQNKSANNAKENAKLRAQRVVGAVDSAIDKIGFSSTGLVGEQLKDYGGTDAYALAGYLDTIQSNLSFEELQKMREASKTGGALGGIAVKELELLGATMTNLRQGLEGPELKKNLGDVKYHYNNVLMALDGKDPYQSLPKGVTEDDVKFTMEKHGLSRDEVIRRLR